MKELEPKFKRLSNDELLKRCLKGLTQNQNGAIKGILWDKCSKTRFCGSRKVRIAVCETVALFNTGTASKAVLMEMCGIEPGANTTRALRLQDKIRIASAARSCCSKRKLKIQRQKTEALCTEKGQVRPILIPTNRGVLC